MKIEERSILSSFDFKKKSVWFGYSIMLLGLAVLAVTMLYPFGTTIFSSFKTRAEIFTFPPSFFRSSWLGAIIRMACNMSIWHGVLQIHFCYLQGMLFFH